MRVQSTGDIEIFCHPAGASGRGSVPFFDTISVGDRLALLFVPDGAATPPYSLKIRSPSGTLVLDTLVREAPTGAPQSPPPIEFIVDAKGLYKIEVSALRGKQRGEATLRVG